jgi:hypothetical protein
MKRFYFALLLGACDHGQVPQDAPAVSLPSLPSLPQLPSPEIPIHDEQPYTWADFCSATEIQMQRVRGPHVVDVGALPVYDDPTSPLVYDPGHFNKDPLQAATALTPDWANMVQQELCNLIEALGGTLDGEDDTQLATLFLLGRFAMGKMWIREQFNWGPTDKTLAASQANVSLLTDKVHVTSGTQTSVLVLAPGAAAAPSPHPAVRLRHLDASTNSSLLLHQANTGSTIATSYRTIDDLDTVQFSMDWRAYLTAVGANQLNVYMGLHETPTDASPDDATAHSFTMFRKLHGDTNWQGRFANDTSGVTDDTGVPPVANTWQDFRLDFFGAATATGVAAGNVSVSKLYIGGALVAEDQTVCPTGAVGLGFMFRIDSTATGPAADHDLVLGPVRMQWNSSAL